MPLPLRPANNTADDASDCRRSFGRRKQEDLHSTLGPVLDLSRGGMRIVTNKRLQGTQQVALFTLEGTFELEAEVAWCKRRGFRRHEIGLSFINIDDVMATRLTKISSVHALTLRHVA
jgi:hypothetical protein